MCQTTPRAVLELPVTREAPALAREFLRGSTCAEHHSAVLDDAVLMVSELVTNSVLHGGPPVVVAVDCNGNELQVRVRDGSPTMPARAVRSAERRERPRARPGGGDVRRLGRRPGAGRQARLVRPPLTRASQLQT